MKPLVVLVALLLNVQVAFSREPYVDYLPHLPSSPTRPTETQQEYLALTLDEEAHFFRKASSADYKSVLRAAAKGSPSNLALVFSSARYQDGAGAESFASKLFWLLHQVGDARFSAVLAKQPRRVRDRVIGLIDFAADYDYSSSFPKTFRLAKHQPT